MHVNLFHVTCSICVHSSLILHVFTRSTIRVIDAISNDILTWYLDTKILYWSNVACRMVIIRANSSDAISLRRMQHIKQLGRSMGGSKVGRWLAIYVSSIIYIFVEVKSTSDCSSVIHQCRCVTDSILHERLSVL